MKRNNLTLLSILIVGIFVGPLFCNNIACAGDGEQTGIEYNCYFGDLHTHTSYSDSYDKECTPWDAYQAAIDAGADFMAVTDHITPHHAYETWSMTEDQWIDTLEAADFYTSEEFIAMAGYEARVLTGGEINIFNTGELPPIGPPGYKYDRLPMFYDWLSETPGAIGLWNHPLYVSDNFDSYNYFTDVRDESITMIEVYNEIIYEDSYIMALDAGWHVMPSANSDTHYTDWIAGHEMRTVLLAPGLTPENLYEAMSAYRGYATLDKNLRVQYTLDGAVMGSNLSEPDSQYIAWIQIEDPDGVSSDEITLVEIITDGGVVIASVPTDGTLVELTIELESEEASYFYVRISTASPLNGGPGITAWTAPVWTGN